MEELYVANTIFALNFFKHLAKVNATQNVFFSPWSISSTMAMVYLGSRGNTEDQMAKVLQFDKVGDYSVAPGAWQNLTGCNSMQQTQSGNYPDAILQFLKDPQLSGYILGTGSDVLLLVTSFHAYGYEIDHEEVSPIASFLDMVMLHPHIYRTGHYGLEEAQVRDKVHSSFHSLSSAINATTGDYLLESVSKLFGEKSARFKEEYLQFCKKYYSMEPQAVDFLECAEESRKKINSWVKTQTKGRIPNLLPEGSVDVETRMVLVNAIYFKGKWKTPFEKKLNGLYPFRVNLTQHVPVQMMYLHEKLNIGYIADLKAQILELPYAGDVSMFLLLPDEVANVSTGLELLESELTYDTLSKWTGKDTMAADDVEVYMPQFKLEERYRLKSILRSMGLEDAFNKHRANFSGMSEGNDLYLSEVFHQATVDVNEEGTEAAAGTGAIMTGRTGHGGPQFVADHPFLFFIMHKITKSILFFGRFSSP